jgi:hypothetical protein
MEKLGVSDSVVFTDFIPDGQLKWALRQYKSLYFSVFKRRFWFAGAGSYALRRAS